MVLVQAAGEPQRGWGGPVAILTAFALIGLLHVVLERRRNLSPTPPPTPGSQASVQVNAGSDPDESGDDPSWWGRIVEVDGVRMRKFRQVLRTGSSELPSPYVPPDDVVDLHLEDDTLPIGEWMLARNSTSCTNDLKREAAARFRVSESTAKRAWNRAQRAAGNN